MIELLRGSTTRLSKARYSALKQKLWQNTNYLQLGGINNWFYAIMTIFVQRFSICSSKFGETPSPSAPTWLRAWQE